MRDLYAKILEFETDPGGRNAEIGFDFQYACAMSDMIDRYINNKDFIVCIENVDDYIVVDENNEITICQCKNYGNWSCTINNLIKKDKNGNSIWNKIKKIHNKLKEILSKSFTNINSMLIINSKNNISIIVDSEQKEAYKTTRYLNLLNLKETDQKTKDILSEGEIVDFGCFFVKRTLDHELFNEQVKDKLNQAIIDKKGMTVTFNPIALYNTLIANLKQKSRTREGVDLQNFVKTIEDLINVKLERFLNYSDVKDYNNYSFSYYDASKVAINYNNLKKILNAQEDMLIESITFSKIKQYKGKAEFNEIVDLCQHDANLNLLSVEEIIAYILLCKGENV